jgi:hypothetical protein
MNRSTAGKHDTLTNSIQGSASNAGNSADEWPTRLENNLQKRFGFPSPSPQFYRRFISRKKQHVQYRKHDMPISARQRNDNAEKSGKLSEMMKENMTVMDILNCFKG